MSMYGPQGGPYPGQPQDPWQGQAAQDPFEVSADPYANGYGDPSYSAGYPEPGHGPAGMPPGDPWGPPVAARRGASGLAVAVTVVLALLAIGGGGAAFYLYSRDNSGKVTGGPADGPATGSSPATTPPSTARSSSPPAGPNADAHAAKVGDCLVNRGSEKVPDMHKVACAANTYEVLKRFDGTADKTRCDELPDRTDWYFYDNTDNRLDFVLCLRKR